MRYDVRQETHQALLLNNVGGEGRRRLVRGKHTRLPRRCRRLRLLVGPTEVRGSAIAMDDYLKEVSYPRWSSEDSTHTNVRFSLGVALFALPP
jgi:hypothetical protein